MKSEFYMQRCIELALNGMGQVAPNPMVGAVIVYKDKIIGEGFHQYYGGAHAEVNAVNSVVDKTKLAHAILYVSLEPCNHYGKTPPCTELIIKNKIPNVVIGSLDPNATVSGKGIKALKEAGVQVSSGILKSQCDDLNKRFFSYHKNKKPYIILKWAQSSDGFIGDIDQPKLSISNEFSQQLVHKWRSEESSILIGTNTAALDNPSLTVRNYYGKNPLRLVIDKDLKLEKKLNLFDSKVPTLVFTKKTRKGKDNLEYVHLPDKLDEIEGILEVLIKKNILSVFVEGGSKLLQSFIKRGLWNEARIFTSDKVLGKGVVAPIINGKVIESVMIKNDTLVVLKNKKE